MGLGNVPVESTVRSPVSGRLIVLMDSGHAYGIRTDEEAEVLVHVGIDTVDMAGEGFTPRVAKGEWVETGQVLADVDLAAVQAAGHSTATVVVTNTAELKSVTPASGDAMALARPASTRGSRDPRIRRRHRRRRDRDHGHPVNRGRTETGRTATASRRIDRTRQPRRREEPR